MAEPMMQQAPPDPFEECMERAKRNGFFMQRELDEGRMDTALKHARDMLCVLRESALSPSEYYEVYMCITKELHYLEEHIVLHADKAAIEKSAGALTTSVSTSKPEGKAVILEELYETVQYCVSIIPRLYLLITVGAAYIRAGHPDPMKVMFDLVEMSKGVQHPMRGLFLRDYLGTMAKGKLPQNEKSSLDFVLRNFAEMTRLWVRMQHQGAMADQARRERERKNLRMLVGMNLHRLSSMPGMDLEMYRAHVLPRLLDQVVRCKDEIAQEYLMDCIVVVFAADFHLATLDALLGKMDELRPKVSRKNIVVALMNRLAQYALDQGPEALSEVELFPKFLEFTERFSQKSEEGANKEEQLQEVLALQTALCNFASKVYPDRLNYVDDCLAVCVTAISQLSSSQSVPASCASSVKALLTAPLETLLLQTLQLTHFGELLKQLAHAERRAVIVAFVRELLQGERRPERYPELADAANVDTLLSLCRDLLVDADDAPARNLEDPVERFEFDQEMSQLSRFVHLAKSDSVVEQFKILQVLRKHFVKVSGDERKRCVLPTLVLAAVELAQSLVGHDSEELTGKKVQQFVYQVLEQLGPVAPQTSIRLFAHAALVADAADYDAITFEFFSQALLLFEEELTSTADQVAALQVLVGAVGALKNLEADNYDTLAGKVTQHAAKLLKKPLQSRMVLSCTPLFWGNIKKDADKVRSCLQKALKIADNIMQAAQKTEIFVAILDAYLRFFQLEVSTVTATHVNNLAELILEQMREQVESGSGLPAKAAKHFANTLRFMATQQSKEGWSEIKVVDFDPATFA